MQTWQQLNVSGNSWFVVHRSEISSLYNQIHWFIRKLSGPRFNKTDPNNDITTQIFHRWDEALNPQLTAFSVIGHRPQVLGCAAMHTTVSLCCVCFVPSMASMLPSLPEQDHVIQTSQEVCEVVCPEQTLNWIDTWGMGWLLSSEYK